jgi:hypothetical protein
VKFLKVCSDLLNLFENPFSNLGNSLGLQGHESFVSHEGLEQLHRFIFVMAVTHVTYSCLTMLLAILKVLPFIMFIICVPPSSVFCQA